MTVPVRSGHCLGDLGQAGKGLAFPGEAFLEDHDSLELALPLSRQQRAGFEADPISGLRRPTVEGNSAIPTPIEAQPPLSGLL